MLPRLLPVYSAATPRASTTLPHPPALTCSTEEAKTLPVTHTFVAVSTAGGLLTSNALTNQQCTTRQHRPLAAAITSSNLPLSKQIQGNLAAFHCLAHRSLTRHRHQNKVVVPQEVAYRQCRRQRARAHVHVHVSTSLALLAGHEGADRQQGIPRAVLLISCSAPILDHS